MFGAPPAQIPRLTLGMTSWRHLVRSPHSASMTALVIETPTLRVQRLHQLLRGDGAVALVDPPFEQVERNLGHLRKSRRHPAALPQTVAGRLGEGEIECDVVRAGKLH